MWVLRNNWCGDPCGRCDTRAGVSLFRSPYYFHGKDFLFFWLYDHKSITTTTTTKPHLLALSSVKVFWSCWHLRYTMKEEKVWTCQAGFLVILPGGKSHWKGLATSTAGSWLNPQAAVRVIWSDPTSDVAATHNAPSVLTVILTTKFRQSKRHQLPENSGLSRIGHPYCKEGFSLGHGVAGGKAERGLLCAVSTWLTSWFLEGGW